MSFIAEHAHNIQKRPLTLVEDIILSKVEESPQRLLATAGQTIDETICRAGQGKKPVNHECPAQIGTVGNYDFGYSLLPPYQRQARHSCTYQ